MRRQPVVAVVFVSFCATLFIGPEVAEARKPNKVARRFERMAKKAYKRKRWSDAIASFEAAHDADPLPKYLYNLGRCHEKDGDFSTSITYFTRYLEEAEDEDADARSDVHALMQVLEIRLRKERSPLRVETQPSGALVQWKGDGEDGDGTSPVTRWLPFGEYTVIISQEGFAAHREKVLMRPGDAVQVDLVLKTPAQARAEAAERAAQGAEEEGVDDDDDLDPPVTARERRRPRPRPRPRESASPGPGWAPWAVLGAGVALVGGGAVFGALTASTVGERDGLLQGERPEHAEYIELRDRAESQALIANVLLAAGVVGVGVGGGWLLLGGNASAGAIPFPGGGLVTLELNR